MMDLLARLIGAAHRARRTLIKDRWKRVLPFGEVFTDRWEKARFLGFGEGASIYDSAVVIGEVKVGSKSWIGPNCILDGSGGLTIGAICSISSGVQIYSHDTVDWAVSGGIAPYRQQATEIGDHVYLGPNTVVAAGSHIGKGCIVGAQSFVKGELAPYTFAAGCPAPIIVAATEAEIVKALARLANPAKRKAVGEALALWSRLSMATGRLGRSAWRCSSRPRGLRWAGRHDG